MSEAIQDFGLFRNTQEEIVLLLSTDPQLFGPPRIGVIRQDLGDIDQQIAEAIGPIGSGGGCVIVGYPKRLPRDPKRPYLLRASIEIQCLETPIVNRSETGNQVRSLRIGEIVFNLLDGWSSQYGWTELLQTSSQSGETVDGYMGDVMVFETETFYSTQTQP